MLLKLPSHSQSLIDERQDKPQGSAGSEESIDGESEEKGDDQHASIHQINLKTVDEWRKKGKKISIEKDRSWVEVDSGNVDHRNHLNTIKTRPSILCVTHQISRKKRNYSVGYTVPYEMMNYKWYLMVLGQYMTILAGTWSV